MGKTKMKIYKYVLPIEIGKINLDMPGGAKVLSFGQDPNGDVCVWALVSPGRSNTPKSFWLAMTGKDVPVSVETSYLFLGTCVLRDEGVVLHCFVEPQTDP